MSDGTALTRRAFLAAAAAMIPMRAAAIGIPAAPDLYEAFSRLSSVTEGTGRATMLVIFAPWCHETPNLHRETRGMLDRLTIRWIPFSGGIAAGRQGTEVLLRNPDPALIPQVLGTGPWKGPTPPTPLSDAQDSAIVRTVEPLFARDLGRVIATPTIAYRVGGDRVRVVPGWLDGGQLAELAAEAS